MKLKITQTLSAQLL